jgi:hypothetical protein
VPPSRDAARYREAKPISTEASAYRTNVGTYETWTCAGCGYTEWYAQDEQGLLERLSHVAQSGVRVVESGAGPPYR